MKRHLLEKQIELIDEIQRTSDINIVTCGNCGSVLLHKRKKEKVKCPYCELTMATSDCPDFLYDGLLNDLCRKEDENI